MIRFRASGAIHSIAGGSELRRRCHSGSWPSDDICLGGRSLVVQLIGTVILARLLTPADFGVVAMVTTFSLLLSSFGSNGFTEAVIQFEEMDDYTASNLFWLNSGGWAWFWQSPLFRAGSALATILPKSTGGECRVGG